jgi:hypothetical protein
MKTELKPCYCGGKAEYVSDLYGEGFMSGICCTSCELLVMEVHGYIEDGGEYLAAEWDDRRTAAERDAS